MSPAASQASALGNRQGSRYAMRNDALTPRERRFAETHHRLIAAFLARKRLPVGDFYGVAALGYLDAVRRYLRKTGLRKYAFSTIANQAMCRSVSHERRKQLTEKRWADTVSMETGGPNGLPLDLSACGHEGRQLEELLVLYSMTQRLSVRQYQMVRLRLAGYSIREIAAMEQISEKKVRNLLCKVRRILREGIKPPAAKCRNARTDGVVRRKERRLSHET